MSVYLRIHAHTLNPRNGGTWMKRGSIRAHPRAVEGASAHPPSLARGRAEGGSVNDEHTNIQTSSATEPL
jgi:hypothetical protein